LVSNANFCAQCGAAKSTEAQQVTPPAAVMAAPPSICHPLVGNWVVVASTLPIIAEHKAQNIVWVEKYNINGTGKTFVIDEKLTKGAEEGSVYHQTELTWQPIAQDRILETHILEDGTTAAIESTFQICGDVKTSCAEGQTITSTKLADDFDITIITSGEKAAKVAGSIIGFAADVALGFAKGYFK